MPTYGYECTRCGYRFEVFQRITDEPITECEKCNGEVRKLFFPVGIVFKGTGFHVTDYRKPDKKDGDGRKPEFSLPSDTSSEKAESKTS
ncbi:MAG: zinc ribbon domain-containing protein [Armatimonadota bacterium]|nr:zinc ribbon domain-containing protein [Armatimonadota bacterium]